MLFPGKILAQSCIAALSLATACLAQDNPAPSPPAHAPAGVRLNYPDSAGGLKNLANDILKARKNGDASRAEVLTASMVLPDPMAWYAEVFGPQAADDGAAYDAGRQNLAAQLEAVFASALQQHFTGVVVKRFESFCDDNAESGTYNLLLGRFESVPIYEVRFSLVDHFVSLAYFAYVDGGFRFFKAPKSGGYSVPPTTPATGAAADKSAEDHAGTAAPPLRIRQGGTVTVESLIEKVQPAYPEVGRQERLQETVRLHAIIGKDGRIKRLSVVTGHCSLAEAAVNAVKQWRYKPMLLAGNPVEVDTTIDVVFALRRQ